MFNDVNDSLPKYGEQVLLLLHSKYDSQKVVAIGQRERTDKNGEHYNGCAHAFEEPKYKVIGWMPLPTPTLIKK